MIYFFFKLRYLYQIGLSSKSYKKNQIKTQFYITLSIAVLTVPGVVLCGSEIDSVFAQTNTTTITLADPQQSSTPQLEPIIQEQGKITNQRVIEVNPHPKIESTFVANSTVLGDILGHDLGTYWATLYANGSVHGEGNGIITTEEGEMVTWTAEGMGNTSTEGDIIFEGSLIYNTSSNGELSYLDNKVGIFVYEVDKQGNTSASVWELK